MGLGNLMVQGKQAVNRSGGNGNNSISQAAPQMNNAALQSNVMVPGINHALGSQDSFMGANVFPIPKAISISVVSNAGAGALAIRVFLFNQDILTNITNNGSGAASVTYVFQDGTATGIVNSSQLAFARAGVGAIIFGVSLRFIVTATRAGDPVGLGTSAPSFVTSNGFGATIPLSFNMSDDQTRKDFDTSIEVNSCVVNMSRFTQFGFIIPVADTAVATFYTTPSFSK